MTTRKPTDICLLCNENLATKTNSHIFSRFISTNFLGPKGSQRRGFELDSDTALNRKPKVIQDSAKEDFLLCNDCEKYFGIIEGLVTDTFYNWREKVTQKLFKQTNIKDFLEIVDFNTLTPKIMHLFVYSLFWRASISSHGLFSNFKLKEDLSEGLRKNLLSYYSKGRKEFLQLIQVDKSEKVYPYTIITAKTFKDETANLLFAPYSFDPYCIIVDRFSFMLYNKLADIKIDFISEFSNTTHSDCRMIVFSEELWNDIMVKKPINLIAKRATENKRK